MQDLKITITETGTEVEHDLGLNPDSSRALRRWKTDPDQAEKHLPTWQDKDLIQSRRISRGDAAAIRDAANEHRKQRES